MNVYQGKSVFGGIAIGHLCVYQKGEQQVISKDLMHPLKSGKLQQQHKKYQRCLRELL